MPAIQPARLKQQASDLAEKFDQPAIFVRQLDALLEHYSDHTHRAGQSGEPSPLLTAYNTPAPVMHQVWVELMRNLKTHPENILPLCDALWQQPNFDLQRLGARLLGQVSIDPAEPVIERMQAWVSSDMDNRLLDALLEHGLAKLQLEAPERFLELVSGWLASEELNFQQAGLRALLLIIRQSGTDSLPPVFRLLAPYLREAPSKLRRDILVGLRALIQASPSETAYWLRQNLSAPDNPDTAWLVRQVVDEFPEAMRAGLKQTMKTGKE